MSWLIFALMTVAAWGVYGILLHAGQVGMGDPVNGRYKAFLLVGLAYFATAVLAPLILIIVKGGNWRFWEYPGPGVWLSFVAGIAGAIGAFAVLLAFGAGGKPAVVMSIIFAGAPVVNAIVSLALHPPKSGLSPMFILGIGLAALGGFLVTKYKPVDPPKKKQAQETAETTAAKSGEDSAS